MHAHKRFLLNLAFACVIGLAGLLSAAHVHANGDLSIPDSVQCLAIHNVGVDTGVVASLINLQFSRLGFRFVSFASKSFCANCYVAYSVRAPPFNS